MHCTVLGAAQPETREAEGVPVQLPPPPPAATQVKAPATHWTVLGARQLEVRELGAEPVQLPPPPGMVGAFGSGLLYKV